MPTKDAIAWYKQTFGAQTTAAVQGTPFSIDLIVAIACQETGGTWNVLRKKGLPTEKLLELCVGDTLDADKGRSAFPKTKAELVAVPKGQEMFNLAHQALVDMAVHIDSYKQVAKNPNKFCHGFGMFQYDIQFFPGDSEYFLQQQYADFAKTLGKAITELKAAQKRNGLQAKTSLTEAEMIGVAIAYNAGSFDPRRGLKQGFFDGDKFYGEHIFDFLHLSQTVPG
jgi:hypothetical protein